MRWLRGLREQPRRGDKEREDRATWSKRRREGGRAPTPSRERSRHFARRTRSELREERDRSREEVEGLKLKIAKLEARCQTPQEKDKEFKLPTEVWAIIAGELDQDDVNQDVLHGCGTPLRRLGNDSPGID